ncbi:fumarylacetoacetate hydrolase family protein [Parasphingorhabdus sp.]|uniref:fumarylacetoacetate hydrolase family protein n=1 Tax=Parasphingorhabdus sp. TaxID=2709688 RepID=UPI003265E748
MSLTHNKPESVYAEVHGTDDRYPVRRIYCVGRNYAAHKEEMGHGDDRDPPFFFTKWADTYVPSGSVIAYPSATENYHYEVELVVAIGRGGSCIAQQDASSHIFGYAVGLDMTRRDLQLVAREKGRPWDAGKNFDQAAPIGKIVPVSQTGELSKARILLEVNGETRQEADIGDLIWNVDEIIESLSKLYVLAPGDLIMTGTPAGVGPVTAGDSLVGQIDGLPDISVAIAARN